MRIPIAVTGAVLLLCGGAALAAGLGAFDAFGALSARPPLDPALVRFAQERGWFLPTAAAVAELTALAGQLWLVVQWRSLVHRRWPDVDARTRDLARLASGELLQEVRELPGVRDVRARLTGTANRPRLRMRIDCAADTPVGELCEELGTGAVERYRHAIGMPTLPAVVRFRPAPERAKRREPEPEPA